MPGMHICGTKNMSMLLNILTLLGALGMFLYGMNMMSECLQKAAGEKMKKILYTFFHTKFGSEERRVRRIKKLDEEKYD